MFVPQSLLSCSLHRSLSVVLLLPFPRGSDLVVFDEDLQGCSLEGAVEGEGTWAHSRRSAPGKRPLPDEQRKFVQQHQAWLPPSGKHVASPLHLVCCVSFVTKLQQPLGK